MRMSNMGLMAVFPAMMIAVCGLPFVLIQLFKISLKENEYMKKAHKVKGKEISNKYVQGLRADKTTILSQREDEIWVWYTYEWKGKTYKAKIRWNQTTYLNLKSKEVDLYFIKNPRKVATNSKALADTQVHWLRPILIFFIIGLITFY